MDWEAEGLLEGLEDDDHRKGRIELLDYLHSEGCELDELKQAVAEDRLVLLPVERLLAGDKTYSQRQIAEEAGPPPHPPPRGSPAPRAAGAPPPPPGGGHPPPP